MKSEKLFNVIGNISDDKIKEADAYAVQTRSAARRFSFLTSPVTALLTAMVLVIGASVYVYHSQLVIIDDDDKGVVAHETEAWRAFEGFIENAEALRDIAVVPEVLPFNFDYDHGGVAAPDWTLEENNGFDGLDFEIKTIAADGYGGFYVAAEITANGFKYKPGGTYTVQGPRINYALTSAGLNDFIFDENGKAVVVAFTFNEALVGMDEYIISFSEMWYWDEQTYTNISLFPDKSVNIRIKNIFPECPVYIWESADTPYSVQTDVLIDAVTITPLGVVIDYSEKAHDNYIDYNININFNIGTSLVTESNYHPASGVRTYWVNEGWKRDNRDYAMFLYNSKPGDYTLPEIMYAIDAVSISDILIWDAYVTPTQYIIDEPAMEGGTAPVPEGLTALDYELIEIVEMLNSGTWVLETDVLDNSEVYVGWFQLRSVLGYNDTPVKLSEIEAAYNNIIASNAQNIFYDPNNGVGYIEGDEFHVSPHRIMHRAVMIYTGSRDDSIYAGATLDTGYRTLTFATGLIHEIYEYNYIYSPQQRSQNNIIGYALGEGEHFIYEDRLHLLPKIEYTFILEDGGWKLYSINPAEYVSDLQFDDRSFILEQAPQSHYEDAVVKDFLYSIMGEFDLMLEYISENHHIGIENEKKNFAEGLYMQSYTVHAIRTLTESEYNDESSIYYAYGLERWTADLIDFAVINVDYSQEHSPASLAKIPQIGNGTYNRNYIVGRASADEPVKIYDYGMWRAWE